MSEEKISASGERAAIGGYLPQFDEFAWFVYLNLINKELEWIRIADPKAEKLDDIQYSTHSEIHAYQVKWTIAEANISYTKFTDLIPLIASSWKTLKMVNPDKKIIPHLITNKPLSLHDSLKSGDKKIGSFEDFYSDVWLKLKSGHSVNNKWKPIIEELKSISKLNATEYEEFILCLDFQANYKQKQFSIANIKYSKEDEDLQQISRFIIEKVASPDRIVEFKRQDIIKELGWSDRFKTIFNHELIVDIHRYQPIQSTINLLNLKLTEHKNGYLFLLGGPGSGKSTLLNQWSKGLKTRIIRYFAFDFVNPSSHLNFYERGNATYLFFDLVFQLKEAGIYKRDILPYKDILFLKDVFVEQLKAVGQDYITNGQQTIIIIDGLDHVPREYKSTVNSFLRELPIPSSLPNGVYIILGSQSYELEDIKQEIKTEFQNDSRTIQIDSLTKEAVYKYIDTLDSPIHFNSSQKLLIFEKSQGHPLYLSYLIEKINEAGSVDDTIKSFTMIDGNIDNYYKKIWEPIQKEEKLINLLGLIARINNSINLEFLKEWGFERSVLKLFKENARFLFNETETTLSFFHNSFKQFLLYHTSLDYLTDKFDPATNLNYHIQLADYYKSSKIEPLWKRNHHLFQAKKYDEFISEVNPNSFTAQLLNFRPIEEIKQDAKLGIEIAKQTRDVRTLVRYLFSLAEIERRLYNIDPASFTEELLLLNKSESAKNYLRTGNTLHCSEAYAFKAARLFIEFDHKSEAEILFNLAYPEVITDFGIIIDDSHNYEVIKDTLEEWILTAPNFVEASTIFSKIENIKFLGNIKKNSFDNTEADLRLCLIINLGHSLIDQIKWDDFDQVLQKLDIKTPKSKNSLFRLIKYAIEKCLEIKDLGRAKSYLTLLTTQFTKEKTKPFAKIFIADLVYKITTNIEETYDWIKDLKQPSNIGKELGFDNSLDAFHPLIKFNNLLNLCSKGVPITIAIPSSPKGTDEEILVEFERMLCLTTQILSEGILQKSVSGDIIRRVYPIVRFYYKEVSHHNNYWYKLTRCKGQYFDFLIYAVSQLNSQYLEDLGDYFFNEFLENPKFWNTSVQRKIIESLLDQGFNNEKAKNQLTLLEESMLDGRDIDGRITECLTHSKVWLDLNELEEAEKWLKQSIQESIGVGYRKDYQFSTWIEWLRKINLKQPLSAPDRIKWFLSHLNHIKETTEGRAFWNASEKLLEATYEYDLYAGFIQTKWQLEKDLIDFESSISIFTEYYVNRVKSEPEFHSIVLLYIELYLLISESPNPSLLKNILHKGYEIFQQKFLEDYIPVIVDAIEIKSFEVNRFSLISTVNEFFLSIELAPENYYSGFKIPLKKEKYSTSSSSNTLILKPNHESLDENDVLEQVNNFEDFKKIIQEEDQANSFFNWSKVIDKITPTLSAIEIKEISTLAKIGNRESDFYAKLSGSALALGDKELALNLANKSIELSSESGWVKHYDGGTRINAFMALRKINPQLSSEKAFEIFAQDIISGDYPNSYIECLEDIAPLLTKQYDEEGLWTEIFDYILRLMSNSIAIKDLPEIEAIDKPILETLIDYLIYLSNSPISLIKEKSTLILARYIGQNYDYALNKFIDDHINEYTSMDILMHLYELKSPKLHNLKSKIKNFSLSKDYLLRENAKLILNELGENFLTPTKISLPAIYSLQIPNSNRPKFNKEIDLYFPDIDINTPQDLIKPFEYLIRILSEESGIEESNLIYRTNSIMRQIGKPEEWSAKFEKELRNHLEEINLKYSYPRPRVITARRAIMQVTNELIDSGIMDDTRIRAVFKSRDYSIYTFKETSKPSFVQEIKEREYGGVGNDWLDRINESTRLNEYLLDYDVNMKIIGEYCQVKNLDWGAPTEEYISQIATTDEIDKDINYIFGSLFHTLSYDYHNLVGGGHSIVVIRDHRFDQFNLKSTWIAINPVLARSLGWRPEPTKLFAWKNSQGELMSESIYWSSGNIDATPRKDGETGEGWFVLVSKKGLEQIKLIESDLYIQKKLIRSKFEESNLKQNMSYKILKLDN